MLTTDQSGLYSTRVKLANPDDHVILPEIISKEPLGPSVRHGDNEWGDVVRWAFYAMLEAEEYGINSKNVDQHEGRAQNPDVQRFLGATDELGKGLGLPNDFAVSDHQAGRQLRRELRAQRRPGLAAEDRARPQRAVEGRRADVQPAVPLSRMGEGPAAAGPGTTIGGAEPSAGDAPVATVTRASLKPPKPAFYNDPRVRSVVYQLVAVVVVFGAIAYLVHNTLINLARLGVASGFGFLQRAAGFPISQTAIDYTPADTFARAFVVGFINTVVVAVVGIVLATIIGFTIGIARLSRNWLVSRFATVYVETVRNMPRPPPAPARVRHPDPRPAAGAREPDLHELRAPQHAAGSTCRGPCRSRASASWRS